MYIFIPKYHVLPCDIGMFCKCERQEQKHLPLRNGTGNSCNMLFARDEFESGIVLTLPLFSLCIIETMTAIQLNELQCIASITVMTIKLYYIQIIRSTYCYVLSFQKSITKLAYITYKYNKYSCAKDSSWTTSTTRLIIVFVWRKLYHVIVKKVMFFSLNCYEIVMLQIVGYVNFGEILH